MALCHRNYGSDFVGQAAPPHRNIHETDGITVNGITYSPQQLSALVLKSVTNDAEEELGEKITDAVITVPAYLGEHPPPGN